MTAVLKAVTSLIGLGSASAPKANVSAATNEVGDAEAAAKQARSALFQTDGGSSGSQLQPGQVQNTRQTLLGN